MIERRNSYDAYRKLEVYEKPEGEELEYPKLIIHSAGAWALVNSAGKYVALMARISDGKLQAVGGCKQFLESKGMATDWAQWEEDGSIKRGEPG